MKHFYLIVVLILLTSCVSIFGGDDGPKLPELPSEIRQWAVSAKASSAYGGVHGGNRDDQSPFAATGETDVESCTDSQRAWVISSEDDGTHWLELTYDKKVFVSKVRIRESLGIGAVVKVELLDNEFKTIWEGQDINEDCPGYFEVYFEESANNVTWEMTPYKTGTIKITLNTDTPGWNEIDAVELVGYDQRWRLFNNTVMFG